MAGHDDDDLIDFYEDDADDAMAVGNVNLSFKENPYQRDGATKYSYVGRVGATVKDNLALRVLLAQV